MRENGVVPIVGGVTEAEISEILDETEATMDAGGALAETRFWGAVAAVKKSPELALLLGERIAEIDRRAFEQWPRIILPLPVGTTLAAGGTLLGLVGIAIAYAVDEPLNWILFSAGVAALLGATHGLAHLLVGRAVGIRFTHWFMASFARPQPGVKLDYASYLRTPPRRRAWMHASGALLGKAIPFLLVPATIAADLPGWFPWALAGFGVLQLIFDIVWSTRSSDWKRFRREMRFASPT